MHTTFRSIPRPSIDGEAYFVCTAYGTIVNMWLNLQLIDNTWPILEAVARLVGLRVIFLAVFMSTFLKEFEYKSSYGVAIIINTTLR